MIVYYCQFIPNQFHEFQFLISTCVCNFLSSILLSLFHCFMIVSMANRAFISIVLIVFFVVLSLFIIYSFCISRPLCEHFLVFFVIVVSFRNVLVDWFCQAYYITYAIMYNEAYIHTNMTDVKRRNIYTYQITPKIFLFDFYLILDSRFDEYSSS